MWDRLKEAWYTKKGGIVVLCWGTAITGVTLWSIQRRKYEREIEKDIIVHLPNSAFAKKSSYRLKRMAEKKENDRILKFDHNRKNPQTSNRILPAVTENVETDEDFDEQSYQQLHSEQFWRFVLSFSVMCQKFEEISCFFYHNKHNKHNKT